MGYYDVLRSGLIALVVTMIGIPIFLHVFKRTSIRQSIREEGPSSHQVKSGTPTMGGLILLLSVAVGSLMSIGFHPELLILLAVFFAFGILGFLDDFVKVVKQRNLGLTVVQKLFLQIVIAGGFGIFQVFVAGAETQIWIPFFDITWEIGRFYIPFITFVVVAMANSVNLTDGLDGLAAGVTFLVALSLSLIALVVFQPSVGVFTGAIAGACFGFLFYNRHPAKIFMGDTGSMALGGGIAAAAIWMRVEVLLLILGAVYVAEALSVLLQVVYFKKTGGKRLLRMAPLHHHFELSGWSESKVVGVFWLATAGLCVIGFILVLW